MKLTDDEKQVLIDMILEADPARSASDPHLEPEDRAYQMGYWTAVARLISMLLLHED